MKATVDKNACIGCELCVQKCPTVFSMDDDGFAQAIHGSVAPEDEASCMDASGSCPVDAIALAG